MITLCLSWFAVPVQTRSSLGSVAATVANRQHVAFLHRPKRCSKHMLGVKVCGASFISCRICKSLLESYICDGSHAHVQAVLESGALFRMDCFCPHVLLKNVSVSVFCYIVVIMYYLSHKAGVCRRLVELSLNSDEKIVIPVVGATRSHYMPPVSLCA